VEIQDVNKLMRMLAAKIKYSETSTWQFVYSAQKKSDGGASVCWQIVRFPRPRPRQRFGYLRCRKSTIMTCLASRLARISITASGSDGYLPKSVAYY